MKAAHTADSEMDKLLVGNHTLLAAQDVDPEGPIEMVQWDHEVDSPVGYNCLGRLMISQATPRK